MVCDPNSNNINIPQPGPSPSLPGLGLPFSVPKTPFSDISDGYFSGYAGIPEDINQLIQNIIAKFPAGVTLQPNLDSASKGVWDALSNLFTQMAPYLAFYGFIQSLLNMITCIMDVVCALLNPFSLTSAVIKLFKNCVPAFLSMFPQFALLVIILSMMLLLITLVEYMITIITSYISQIIENIDVLTRAIQVSDADAILACVNKISYLTCLIEQIFALLTMFSAVMAVIQPLLSVAGSGICSSSSGSSCCTQDFCPDFIKNNSNGLVSKTGRLIYFTKISADLTGVPDVLVSLPGLDSSLRQESWQIVDTNPGDSSFLSIITPSPTYGFIYWPDNNTYPATSNLNRVPYLLDLEVSLDPKLFGNSSDLKGPRLFSIRDVIVYQKPTEYPESWNNGTDTSVPKSGSLMLVGGSVFEVLSDGYQSYLINGTQATLQTLIHKPGSTGSIPSTDDGYSFLNINYNLRYNYPALVDYKMISLMCQPDTAAEAAVVNAQYSDIQSVIDKAGPLPDTASTIACLTNSLSAFRKNLNAETAAIFQSESTACLNTLKSQASDYYCNGVAATVDRFTSDFSISPDMQFVDGYIVATVTLKDKTGTQLAVKVGSDIGACIASLITSNVTFGSITSFVYDGYGQFTAKITSKKAGSGTLSVYLSSQPISSIENRDNVSIPSSIVQRYLPYEFIDKTSIVYRRDQGDEYKTRFDASDIGGE